jgi:hypothetical protein
MMTRITRSRGIQAVLKWMTSDLNKHDSRCAFELLATMALDDYIGAEIVRKGGISEIVQAMRQHKDNIPVQKEACTALRNLAGNEKNKTLS